MEYFRHVFAFIYIVLLILFMRFLFRKGELHFKMLKELYPDSFKGIESFYNPLLSFYIFGLDADILFWFIVPLYFRKKDISIINNDRLILLDKKLRNNNKKIFLLLILSIIWLFGIGYLISHI